MSDCLSLPSLPQAVAGTIVLPRPSARKQQIKCLCAAALLTFAVLGGAAAGPYEDGHTAYLRGDFAAAIRLWRPLADQGRAVAQFDLGEIYADGRGMQQDFAQAFTWFRRAALQGYPRAQFKIGTMYAMGQGVRQDYLQALKWYRKAAVRGDPSAQLNLGQMYLNGQGIRHDYAQALVWLREAAERGVSKAQFDLAAMYALGQGTSQDYVRAHKWFSLSALYAEDAETRALAVKNREISTAKMTPDQIAEAQRMAREWTAK